MIDSFRGFIREKKLFSANDRILLALSGGIDSMVMLDLFLKTGYRIGIIHCNFSLRGAESDDDEKFLKQIAARNKIGFYSRRFNTKAYAAEKKISVQMAARDLRYTFFEEIRREEGYHVIAVAHQLNDSAETLLFNLSRGTGITGLKGIPAKNGKIVRPFLFATRDRIHDYAVQHKLKWREDSSNNAIRYSRNYIRHKVIPHLLKLNPNFYNTVRRTLEQTESTENLLLKWIRENRKELITEKNRVVYLSQEKIRHYAEPVLLHFMIRDYGFTYEQSALIFSVMGRQPGAQFYSESHLLTVDRRDLVISPHKDQLAHDWTISPGQEVLDTNTGERFRFRVITKPENLKSPGNTAFLALEKLEFPLIIRTPQEGDRFQPFGMKGQQKLSDFMINNKIPRNLKYGLKLLVSGKKIAWVAGYRIDERFKAGRGTSKVLRVDYENNK